ncbi:MAG: DUF5671 domain-containing protein [Maricaulaceae bacterium]|jgi:prepilin signal peptidase PulO-like enzyme (type II secretory pathway)
MVDKALSDFVREALGKGAKPDEIEAALAKSGWPAAQIQSALGAYASEPFVVPVPRPSAYISAREAFLYILLFILLGVIAGHLGALLFTLIGIFIPPDVIQPWMANTASGTIRWAVSALVVALPTYLILSWRLARARRNNPAMQGSRIRKWLTYLALVIAAGTLIGDLIAVVYNLLSGELTLRFFLKAAVIAAIAGGIFAHYVREAERDDSAGTPLLLEMALGLGLALVGGVASITGVALIDSPARLRMQERDEARMQAVSEIAGAVDCYYSYEGELPEDLETMRGFLDARARTTSIAGSCRWGERRDPATDAPYEYRPLDGAEYELCATFDLPTDDSDDPRTYAYSSGYRLGYGSRTIAAVHDAGRHCFTLEAVELETAFPF